MTGRHLVLIALLAAAGCAHDEGAGPSLAPRAIEGRGWAEPVIAPAPPATADPALAATLDERRKTLADNAAVFDTEAARAARLVTAARGDAPGGGRWVAAQSALAGLDARRATTSELASDLEGLALDRARAGTPEDPALAALQAAAEAQLARQTARIGELQSALPAG